MTNLKKGIEFMAKSQISIPYIFATQCCRPMIFKTMNSDWWNDLRLKYQRATPSGCKYIGIRTFEFVAKTYFLSYT